MSEEDKSCVRNIVNAYIPGNNDFEITYLPEQQKIIGEPMSSSPWSCLCANANNQTPDYQVEIAQGSPVPQMQLFCKTCETFTPQHPIGIPLNKLNMGIFQVININANFPDNKSSKNIGAEYWEKDFEHIKVFENKKLNQALITSISGNSDDVAVFLKELKSDEWVYDSRWYRFVNHIYVESVKESFETYFPNYLVDHVTGYYETLKRLYDQSPHFSEKERIERQKMIHKLVGSDFKGEFVYKILERAKCRFGKVGEFAKKLNHNPKLLAFNNGIYDFQKEELRDGNPEDMISFQIPYDYVDYTDNLPYMDEIRNFFQQVFTDPDVRHYVLKHLSSCLTGPNEEELMHIWLGEGANGKSLLNKLMMDLLGESQSESSYALMFPSSVLTEQDQSSNAFNSFLRRSVGKRYVGISELNKNQRLNMERVRLCTSHSDMLAAREMFETMIYFTAQFKMVLSTNNLPKITEIEEGCWRRLVAVRLSSSFVANPDPSNPMQFKVDYTLQERSKNWTQTLMSYLVHYYFEYYKTEGLKPAPEAIARLTREYRLSSNKVQQFLDECCEFGAGMKIFADTLKKRFTNWARENDCTDREIERLIKQLRENISQKAKYDTVYSEGDTKKGWKGLKLQVK